MFPGVLKSRLKALTIAAALAFVFVVSEGSAQANDVDELTSAFLFRLSTMTTWPDGEADEWPATVCIAVLGSEGVARKLKQVMRNRQLFGHDVEVRALSNPDSASKCVVAYVMGSHIDGLLAAAASTSTISSDDGFIERGGMIQFIRESGRLRFKISRSAMSKRGLTMSSRVLRLGVSVD